MLNGHYHRKRDHQSAQHVGEEADGGMKILFFIFPSAFAAKKSF